MYNTLRAKVTDSLRLATQIQLKKKFEKIMNSRNGAAKRGRNVHAGLTLIIL